MMKKFVVIIGFILIAALSACSPEDDLALRFEPLEVLAVSFPEVLHPLETYKVHVTYIRPTSCHYFEGVDYEQKIENETTVFLIASVLDEQPCKELNIEAEASFDFKPQNKGDYIFRFWQGKGQDGEDIYYTVTVTVE